MPRAQRHRDAALAAAGVEHAPRPQRGDLPLQLLELRVSRPALDQLARLASDEHADPLLEELQPRLPAQAAVLLLLRVDERLARLQVRQPGADARRLLRVARVGIRRLGSLDDLERAVDVLAIELEPDRLNDGVDVARIHEP